MRSTDTADETNETDESLMAAVRDGDSEKLGTLFDRHHGSLFDFFSRLTGDRALSQDLVQEVFFRILKYRSTYRSGGSFTAWMYRIARNARTDHFKKRQNDHLREESDIQLEVCVETSFWDRLAEGLELERQTALLERALLLLPLEKRELIVLARYQRMRYVEIAALLEIDVGAVKVRVHRAIRELEAIVIRLVDETGEKTLCDAKKSADILPST